ncbi:MAG: hypothetical protein HY706_02845 [Candidatus Hydrogenedentes bacterium]|nr:hypothetical protein [Candidatus Hydrogenedentota bacterium]
MLTPTVEHHFEGVYTNFTLEGDYEIAIFAVDTDGNVSVPSTTKVIQTQPSMALAGDIDADGGVDAVDVQLVINAALGLDIGALDADVNQDAQVDAVDVQLVINAALGIL